MVDIREAFLAKFLRNEQTGVTYDPTTGMYTDGRTQQLAPRADRLALGRMSGRELRSGSVWAFDRSGEPKKVK